MKPPFSQAKPPESICIMRLSAIGDVCHVVAVVQQLQKYWPNTAITWVIGKSEYQLLKGLPGVEFIPFDKHGGVGEHIKLYRQLRKRRFDILLHMQFSLRASLLSLMISAKYRVGFDRMRAKDIQWLFTNIKIAHTANQHILDLLLSFLPSIGLKPLPASWNVPIAAEDLAFAKQFNQGKKILVVTPASSVSVRNWTQQGYLEVMQYALSQHNMTVIVCGANSPIEQDLSAVIEQHFGDRVINLMGKTNLKQCLAILAEADVLIAPDTGPAHMATLVQTPVISLFACTNPERAAPYLSKRLVINAYPQARREFLGEQHHTYAWDKRIWDQRAMSRIEVKQVCQALDGLLQQRVQLERCDEQA